MFCLDVVEHNPQNLITCQCVSAEVLKELSEFFQWDNVSRPCSWSIVVGGEETPIRYSKDSVKELVKTQCWQACATCVMSLGT